MYMYLQTKTTTPPCQDILSNIYRERTPVFIFKYIQTTFSSMFESRVKCLCKT